LAEVNVSTPKGDAVSSGWLDGLIELSCGEQPILVAHSTPGALAARFAVEHGDRLRRLVLVDAAGLAPFRPSPGLLVAAARLPWS